MRLGLPAMQQQSNSSKMKQKITKQSAFLYLRVSIGLLLGLAGVSLALMGIGQYSAQARQRGQSNNLVNPALIPPLFDCSQLQSLGFNMQENFRAGALMIYCGQSQGGSPEEFEEESSSIGEQLLAPLLGGTDQDLITGTQTGTHIIQSETFSARNPDNPNEILVAYNDSRGVASNPINLSGVSVSTDGGTTWTRLTQTTGQSPFKNTLGDPVVLYNRPTGTWFTAWIDLGCGSQGIGGYKSNNPTDPNSWTHYCVHNGTGDDRESGWADNNPSSPFYGHMYISWNDFGAGGNLKVRFSADNGNTWTEKQLAPANPFIRDVQIVGDPVTGAVYVAGMDEGGGGLANRINKMYRSTDGGNTWTLTYSGPSFPAPGAALCTSNTYFACMFAGPAFWRHMGWGQPAALNGVVHYVYDSRNPSNGDTGNVFYIRSTDGGQTFSTPIQLNTDTTTRPQWQPNISASTDGSLVAVWYDARESTSCSKGNPAVPCYRMWARRSLDNGVTWQPDEPLSDVVSPLPGQSDSNIVTEYAGDYDYSFADAVAHLHTWTDGRVAISNSSQQDAFFDQVTNGGGTLNLLSAASRLTHRSVGTFDVPMPLTGSSGVEDRDGGGNYLAVFTFSAPVTSGSASIVSGTAVAGAPSFSGNEMRVPLTGVTDVQVVTIRVSNVNGTGGSNDVPFGFLIADVNGNRTVDKPDATQIQTDRGQPVTSTNFRDDINLSGVVDKGDNSAVRNHKGNHL
jgi:hypothetical protein